MWQNGQWHDGSNGMQFDTSGYRPGGAGRTYDPNKPWLGGWDGVGLRFIPPTVSPMTSARLMIRRLP
jgi:hypothetical protein